MNDLKVEVSKSVMNNRNIAIDIVKLLAVILITNSHMDIMYPKYTFLATGGAIGDSLFFFCSGFTLLLSKNRDLSFANWYKRRVRRLYPTIFSVAILSTLLCGKELNIISIILYGGKWFGSCIMLYYIPLYFVQKYLRSKLWIVFTISGIISVLYFFFIHKDIYVFAVQDIGKLKWVCYFNVMLFGSYIGTKMNSLRINPKFDLVKLLVSVVVYYAIYVLIQRTHWLLPFQLFTYLLLLPVCYYFYKICSCRLFVEFASKKSINTIVMFVGSMCFEIYLVQEYIITDGINYLFPANLIIIFGAILLVAYMARILGAFLTQLCDKENFRWRELF